MLLVDTSNSNFILTFLASIPYGDKIGHFFGFGVLSLLLNYGLNFKSYKMLGFNMQLGALIVLAFAIIEEGTQYYIPSRTFDLYDVLGDFIGVVLFSL
jgi:VanZ family protein